MELGKFIKEGTGDVAVRILRVAPDRDGAMARWRRSLAVLGRVVDGLEQRLRFAPRSGAVGGALLLTGGAIGMAVLGAVPGKAQVCGWIFCPLLALVAIHLWNAGIHVRAEGLYVVHLAFNQRIAWGDVAGFELRPFAGYALVVHVIRTGGRDPVPVLTLSSGRVAKERARSRLERILGQLDGALDLWRQGRLRPVDYT